MGEFNTITRLVSANVRIIGKTRDTGGGTFGLTSREWGWFGTGNPGISPR